MEIKEIPDETGSAEPLAVKFRKLNVTVVSSPEDFPISSEQDFDTAVKIAHAYSKDFSEGQPTLETFKQIGTRIGRDFQFTDQGAGIDTLAGQLRKNSVEDRDCKLPTLLLALIWKELNPNNSPSIVAIKSNMAHPYVSLKIGSKTFFGHFFKPREVGYNSGFELLNNEHAQELKNFIAKDRAVSYSPDLQGMIAIDGAFRER